MLIPLPILFHCIKKKTYKASPIIPFYEEEIEIWKEVK